MAKYSKEQRRCAVELYVRYECCAADVIRELGYPSSGGSARKVAHFGSWPSMAR